MNRTAVVCVALTLFSFSSLFPAPASAAQEQTPPKRGTPPAAY